MKTGKVIWFTGLSGAGKTTIARAYKKFLRSQNISVAHLDGDDLRTGLCSDLGFDAHDRSENLRRAAHVARILADNNSLVLASFISPYNTDRENVRKIIGDQDFLLVYTNASLAACQQRDVKGLYAKATSGEIKNFTGITDQYEVPSNAFVLDTVTASIDKCIDQLHRVVLEKFNFE
jgi:adenylyl-sulfate kinase